MGRRSAYRTPTLWAIGRFAIGRFANGRFAIGYRRKARGDQAKGKGNGCTEVQPLFFSIKTGAVRDLMVKVAK